jgi:GntR family transcriptional regulator
LDKEAIVLLSINEKDNRPIYQQLAGQIKEQVSRGLLEPGDELPSVRELSSSLGINMHTVRRAYLMLRDLGIIDLRLGRRARISREKPLHPLNTGTVNEISMRLAELVTDALLAGISPDEFRKMVAKQLEQE